MTRTTASVSFAEYARLDSKRWHIFGIELFGGALNEWSWAWVLAIDSQQMEAAGGYEAFVREHHGRVPVTRFRVLESDAFGVLRAMKQWSIRVAPRRTRDEDTPLLIESTVEQRTMDE